MFFNLFVFTKNVLFKNRIKLKNIIIYHYHNFINKKKIRNMQKDRITFKNIISSLC